MRTVTQNVDLTARETEIIRTLSAFNSHLEKFVVIGGYAVSALALHRFSVDCDIVVSWSEIGWFKSVLISEGYQESVEARVTKSIHNAKTIKFIKKIAGGEISVDLFVNSLVSRNTLGEWSYDEISENSIRAIIVGITDSTPARVPKKELLIALKLHACRDTDLRDIVMLDEGVDWNAVADFANTGKKIVLDEQLNLALRKIESKEFSNSLKAEFGLRKNVLTSIEKTVTRLKKVRRLLEDR